MNEVLEPIADRVLVRVDVIAERTASGLYIPEAARTGVKIVKGTIVTVGTDEWAQKLCKPGDRVLFDEYAGQKVDVNGLEHKIMKVNDLIAFIRGQQAQPSGPEIKESL